jgi:hypothetical protein
MHKGVSTIHLYGCCKELYANVIMFQDHGSQYQALVMLRSLIFHGHISQHLVLVLIMSSWKHQFQTETVTTHHTLMTHM